MRRCAGFLLLLACFAALALPSTASAAGERRAMLVFYDAAAKDVLVLPPPGEGASYDGFLRFLGEQPGLRLGLWSSLQGGYNQQQAVLDISQGARQPTGLYDKIDTDGDDRLDTMRFQGPSRTFAQWDAFRQRARDVSRTLRPGLLAESVPGGAGYAGVLGEPFTPGIAAADRSGRVSERSSGRVSTLADRAAALNRRKQFVVVSVPHGEEGRAQIAKLARDRDPDQLLVVAQLPRTLERGFIFRPPSFLLRQPAFAIADGREGSPTSPSTRRDGLITANDMAPTVLEWIGVEPPDAMRGETIETTGAISAERLEERRKRWSGVRGGRQAQSLTAIVGISVILFLLVGALRGPGSAVRPALRIGGLAFMWWPTTVLLSAAIEPTSKGDEVSLIAGSAVLLAILTERLLPWRRAPAVPAAVCLLAYTADLANAGGELLTRSVLGPSVTSGSRFYGVSNELEPVLPIMLLVGLAAVLGTRRDRTAIAAYIGGAVVLLIVVCWGRLGADVGGVATIGVGMGVATLVMLPALTRRAVVLTVLAPAVALAGLILIDLTLSGGSHLSRNLSRADSPAELWELVERRYELSWGVIKGSKGTDLLAAVLAAVFAWRNRDRLYDALPSRAWLAVLLGGLAGGIAGALTNDSGPVLFINATIALACVTAYLLGRPDEARTAAADGPPPSPTVSAPAEPVVA